MDTLTLNERLAPGWYLVESESATRYALRWGQGRPHMIRITGAGTHGRAWWDDQVVPLLGIWSISDDGTEPLPSTVRVGCRHRWLADPEGTLGESDWWWIQRTCTGIRKVSEDEIAQLPRGRPRHTHLPAASAAGRTSRGRQPGNSSP